MMDWTGIVDLHAHVLPGVDDGAKDLAMSLDIAQRAVEEGIELMVATPHTLDGVYDVQRTHAAEALAELRHALHSHRIPLEVRLAAEVHLHESIIDRIAKDPTLTLDGERRYLLLELPHQTLPPNLTAFLFQLRASGTTPLIAHPERNLTVRGDPAIVTGWIQAGARLQLTAGSLDGTFGPVIRACGETLLAAGHAHIVATDTHHPERRPPNMREAIAAASAIVGAEGAHRLVYDNPRRVLAGQPLQPVRPIAKAAGDERRTTGRRRSRRSRLLTRWFR